MKMKAVRCRVFIFLFASLMLIIFSLLAPAIAPNDPNATNSAAIRLAPGIRYPFGTDNLGRCVFSRVLAGAGTSVLSSLSLVLLCAAVGTVVGLLCGYYGGFCDQLWMHGMDLILSIPQMVLAIAVSGILGGGMGNAMLAMGISSWILFARLIRVQVLTEKTKEYVLAARLAGRSDGYLLFNEILPNVAGPLAVTAATQMAAMMTGLAGLSFLGLGVQVPQAEWGSMIREARAYIQLAPWAVFFPAGAIMLHVMVFGLLGDAVRDLLDTEVEQQ